MILNKNKKYFAIIYNPNQIPYLGRGVYFPTLKIIFANTHKTFIRICF